MDDTEHLSADNPPPQGAVLERPDGSHVVVRTVHPPKPEYAHEPWRTRGMAPRARQRHVRRMLEGWVDVEPAAKCWRHCDPDTRPHEAYPEGWHRHRNRWSEIRLDRLSRFTVVAPPDAYDPDDPEEDEDG